MSKSFMVTGASRGIGLATVRQFFYKDNGVREFILLARDSPDYEQAVDELERDNRYDKKIHAYAADLADREALLPLMKEIKERHEKVDLLVNNAGYTAPAPLHEVDFGQFERTIAVNLYAPFLVVQTLLRLGNTFDLIVNIASTAGIAGRFVDSQNLVVRL